MSLIILKSSYVSSAKKLTIGTDLSCPTLDEMNLANIVSGKDLIVSKLIQYLLVSSLNLTDNICLISEAIDQTLKVIISLEPSVTSPSCGMSFLNKRHCPGVIVALLGKLQ